MKRARRHKKQHGTWPKRIDLKLTPLFLLSSGLTKRDGDCLIWQGYISEAGVASFGDTTARRRVAIDNGIPAAKFYIMECGNRSCVSPLHIKPTDRAVNRPESQARHSGSSQFITMFSDGDAQKIQDALDQGQTQASIATALGVHQSTISRLLRRSEKASSS